MKRLPPTAGKCGTILAAAVLFGLHGCHQAPGTRAGNGVATVSWIAPTQNSDGSKITDLAGYAIYYGTNPDNLNESIQVRDPAATTYTIAHLSSGSTYYFSVAALTATGNRGGTSATVSKAIP